MRDRDYVWCLSHLALDQEEELERLCPVFDQERYERLRKGAKA